MMATQSPRRRGLMWAIIGGIILLVGIATIIVIAVTAPRNPVPTPAASDSQQPTAEPSVPGADGDVVDASVTEQGWIPEPITTDAEAYIRSALAAASTFDTTLADRDDWLTYLDSWLTPDTRYTTPNDQADRMRAAKLELRQGVVLPQEEWDSLARSDGRVVAEVSSEVVSTDVPDDASGDMSIGTADVTLTFTQGDGSGGETSFDDVVRVSVQVLCGPESVSTPGSAQRAGDCKVVRFFTEPLEP